MEEYLPYGYQKLCSDIHNLCSKDPAWRKEMIGYSVCGRPIWALHYGSQPVILINASHHANEWITSLVLMQWLLERNPTHPVTVVPMVNPDGVSLVTGEITPDSTYYQKAKTLSKTIPFPSGWKANANGVDLNLNYPAGWDCACAIKQAAGFNAPSARDWPGLAPLSEPETRAMVRLTERGYQRSLSLHSQGGEIYWDFCHYAPSGSRDIAEKMAGVSGYVVASPPPYASYGGYKDWFLQEYRRPAYTIEIGRGENPLPISDLPNLRNEVFPLLDIFCSMSA